MQHQLRVGAVPLLKPLSCLRRRAHALSYRGARRRAVNAVAFVRDDIKREKLTTSVCIIGSGPAAHTAAIYAARAELEPIVFEGWMANGIAAGGQLTTTSYVENFPGFPEPIMGWELCENFRKQSRHHGARLIQETVTSLDLSVHPFQIYTDAKEVTADTVIIATGAVAKRLKFPGSGDGPNGFWNRGISACAVCDGASMRNLPVAIVGGGDTAMEEAMFLTRYASKVYIVHRFDYFEASKVMSRRAVDHPKIEVLWSHEVLEAHGNEHLEYLKVRNNKSGEVHDLEVSGLFFAIGHRPATDFLGGQVPLDDYGYVVTTPGTASTSIPGVFAAGDVQDRKYRQAITAAGSGCMAALEAERYLQDLHSGSTLEAEAAAAFGAPPSANEASKAGQAAVQQPQLVR